MSGQKRQSKGDFYFGFSEYEPDTMEYMTNNEPIMNTMTDSDWTLPKEAFPLRHEIQDRSPPPEQFPNHSLEINDDSNSVTVDDQPQLIVTSVPKLTFWNPGPTVEEALRYHAELGDIQTSVSLLIALGERRKSIKIEIAVQEHWLLEYIDMLGRFKLYEVSTEVFF